MNKFLINDVKIQHDTPVLDVLARLDTNLADFLLVYNNNRAVGFITDQIVRKNLANKSFLNKLAGDIAFKTILRKTPDKTQLISIFRQNPSLELLPVVNKTLVNPIYRHQIFNSESPLQSLADIPVVIMAGGFGTRLHPFTKVIPKPLLPVGDRTIIELIINKFRKYQITRFILTVNYKANFIKAFFTDLRPDYNVEFISENQPLGTAGSLRYLLGKIDKPFFVSNCDIIINTNYRKFYNFHIKGGFDLSLVAAIIPFRVPYGVCEINEDFSLKNLQEKPTIYHLVNTGMYILNPEVLSLIPENKHFHMTELMDKVIQNGGKVGVYPISNRSWKDYGQAHNFRKTLQI